MTQRRFSWRLLGGAARRLALVVAACGGSSNEQRQQQSVEDQAANAAPRRASRAASSPSSPPPTSTTSTRARRTTRSATWSATRPTGRCTRSSPTTRTKPVPDLADGDPQISADNKTITVKIKRASSSPRRSTARSRPKDIKYAIERAFTAQRAVRLRRRRTSPTSWARPRSPTKGVKPISGIRRRTTTRSSSSSTSRVAPRWPPALVMPITMPVPEEYAKKFDAKNPSTYDQYVAFTGPYMVKNNAHGQARRAASRASRSRSSATRTGTRTTDYRPAYLDAITIEEGNDDLTVASRRTLQRPRDSCAATPASRRSPVLKRALTRNKDQLGRSSRRRHALHRAEHDDQAVRQHQRPQGASSPASTATRCA